jgi:hypothetical protein
MTKWKKIQFICTGDFHQYDAICNSWCGSPVPEGMLEMSDMLFDLCDGQMLTMLTNKRSDPILFNFFTNLSENFANDVRRAKKMFPKQKRKVDYYLTMSHVRRVQLNRQMNILNKPPGAIELKAPPPTRSGNLPQDMWVYPGQQLIGFGGPCKKGLFYFVQSAGETIKLTDGTELSHDQAVRCLRLSHALTFACIQGLTLEGVVELQCDSVNFTKKNLYVGISRATSHLLVQVV